MSDEDIKRAIATDPDSAPPYDLDDSKAIKAAWKNGIESHSYAELKQQLAERRRKRGERGPQKAPTKLAVTVRLDRDVLARLKASGEGWQTRLNALLRSCIDAFK